MAARLEESGCRPSRVCHRDLVRTLRGHWVQGTWRAPPKRNAVVERCPRPCAPSAPGGMGSAATGSLPQRHWRCHC